jgi:multifunctional methyltransferase subunit TRM112
MKILTLNFLTCARKACKPSPASFPLHPQQVTLETVETDFNPLFLSNILPRLEWPALLSVCNELGLPGLVEACPEPEQLFDGAVPATSTGALVEGGEVMGEEEEKKVEETEKKPSQLARDLHRLLIETCISEGKLVCGNCGHEYAIKEGIANFLLPPHLV